MAQLSCTPKSCALMSLLSHPTAAEPAPGTRSGPLAVLRRTAWLAVVGFYPAPLLNSHRSATVSGRARGGHVYGVIPIASGGPPFVAIRGTKYAVQTGAGNHRKCYGPGCTSDPGSGFPGAASFARTSDSNDSLSKGLSRNASGLGMAGSLKSKKASTNGAV